ncbi:MAG: BON domain-containing protein [Anaerolineae bacterium]|nr:BON domain-containing protein [Anaerolineae bacterium]
MNLTSTSLTHTIISALNTDGRTAGYGIEALEEDGVVTLTGTIPSTNVEAAAVEIAGNLPGVQQVISDLEVADVARPKFGK